jgi:hypothetical protein
MKKQIKVEPWDSGEFVITVDGKVIGQSISSKKEAEDKANWLKTSIGEIENIILNKPEEPPFDTEEISVGGGLERIEVIDEEIFQSILKQDFIPAIRESIKKVELIAYHQGKADALEIASICLKDKKDISEKIFPIQWLVKDSEEYGGMRVTIDLVYSSDNKTRYAIRNGSSCWTTEEECFDYERMPSNRSEEYLASRRFNSFELTVAEIPKVLEYFKKQYKKG